MSAATIRVSLQGILLTVEALGFFVAAMMLMPQVNRAAAGFWVFGRQASRPPTAPQPGTAQAVARRQWHAGSGQRTARAPANNQQPLVVLLVRCAIVIQVRPNLL